MPDQFITRRADELTDTEPDVPQLGEFRMPVAGVVAGVLLAVVAVMFAAGLVVLS